LNREVARRRELLEYNYTRSRMQLEGALQSAERALIQVERDNSADLAQAKAWKDSSEQSLEREEERLERYREQLDKCKIYAPQDGMVAYHVESSRWGSSSKIEEGVAVRDRQPILSIPSLNLMQVKTSVHESVVDRVKVGMPATVRLDAFPDRQYEATVDSVAVLPDPGGWLSSDTKVYKTIVTINDELDPDIAKLKPGMTAVAEIHINHLTDVICVPVQALVQRADETWCYVDEGDGPERRSVEVGQTNDKFVEITSGLEIGDQVVLNPSAILGSDAEESPNQIAPDRESTDDVATR
jgi:RND family efflux transporter MFP subunit